MPANTRPFAKRFDMRFDLTFDERMLIEKAIAAELDGEFSRACKLHKVWLPGDSPTPAFAKTGVF